MNFASLSGQGDARFRVLGLGFRVYGSLSGQGDARECKCPADSEGRASPTWRFVGSYKGDVSTVSIVSYNYN